MFDTIIKLFSEWGKERKGEVKKEIEKNNTFINAIETKSVKKVDGLEKATYGEVIIKLRTMVLELFELAIEYKGIDTNKDFIVTFYDHFRSIINLIEFYQKRLNVWDKNYYEAKKILSQHHRTAFPKILELDLCLKELEPIYNRIQIIKKTNPENASSLAFEYLNSPDNYSFKYSDIPFVQNLFFELLLIFDSYTFSMWRFLENTAIINRGGQHESNEYFIENYESEFRENFGITKNIIVDCFFNNLSDPEIASTFKLFFKTLIKWRIPFTKSFVGFPDGNLIDLPVIYKNQEYAKYTKRTYCLLKGGLSFDASPKIFLSVERAEKSSFKYELAIPKPLENPTFTDVSKLISLIPQKYRKR